MKDYHPSELARALDVPCDGHQTNNFSAQLHYDIVELCVCSAGQPVGMPLTSYQEKDTTATNKRVLRTQTKGLDFILHDLDRVHAVERFSEEGFQSTDLEHAHILLFWFFRVDSTNGNYTLLKSVRLEPWNVLQREQGRFVGPLIRQAMFRLPKL